MNQTTIIGIAGGSGSGKTTVTNEIMKNLEGHSVALLAQDYYYKDQSHLTLKKDLRQIMIIHSHSIMIYLYKILKI